MKLFLAVVTEASFCLHRVESRAYADGRFLCDHPLRNRKRGPALCSPRDEEAFPATCPHADFEVSRALGTTESLGDDPVIKELTRVLQARYALEKIGDGT